MELPLWGIAGRKEESRHCSASGCRRRSGVKELK
uniref:Uncharacterized protein n=1 Tax=Nelumbo nucifera TaxID=4432 RepID=A0A822XW29_NELNU|nr:TPA_asm: hypothetical protein HUJ06_025665 [Nelumbo nucifera]